MSRSKWKGPFIHFKFFKKKYLKNTFYKIWSRDSIILSHFLNYKFLIFCGNIFKKLVISREKVGYKFGEFCTTRSKYFHKNKLNNLKNKKPQQKLKKK